jgi:assimilatory nitrate reductase catalytic subunit
VLLPAAAWGEKDGTVTNSERRISRQRPFLAMPGEARPDWWIVTQAAKRMGFAEAFDFNSAADIFREHAALSAFENDGTRDFDIGALAGVSDDEFNALDPVQWPARVNPVKDETRFFADGRFFTPDRKARMIAPEMPCPQAGTSAEYPLRLNTGRVRDQWHTMTRTGLSPRLGAHLPEPFVEVHADDAARHRLSHGGFARVTSPYGACVLRVVVSEGQQRGSLFAPIHWSDETASSARVGELVTPANDPFSGQPEAKASPAAIAPVEYRYRGFVLSRARVAVPAETWWARASVAGGEGLLLASNDAPQVWRERAAALFGAQAELTEYVDELRGGYRVAAFIDGRLAGCLFIGPAAAAPQWDAVKSLFDAETLGEAQRRAVLSGKSTDGIADPGPVVCACFGVGLNVIRAAIQNGAANTDEIGKALRAGTNCGSCLPELKRIVSDGRVAQAV